MKTGFFFIIILAVNISVIKTQKIVANSVVKATHSTYKTDSLRFGGVSIENEKNIYHDKKPNSDRLSVNIEKSDNSSTINTFKQIFSNDRMKQLGNETIAVKYFISDDGKVLEVAFVLNKNTQITVWEIEGLEDAIKKNVSFKLHGRDAKVGGFFIQFQIISFRKILDGTFPG